MNSNHPDISRVSTKPNQASVLKGSASSSFDPTLESKEVALAYRMRVLFEAKVTSKYRKSFKGELGRTQAEVLEYLYEYGPSRAQAIAEAIHVPKQHVSKILAQFSTDKLVSSSTSKEDKRAKVVCLTSEGKALIESHLADSAQVFMHRLENLTQKERDELTTSMESIIALLEKI